MSRACNAWVFSASSNVSVYSSCCRGVPKSNTYKKNSAGNRIPIKFKFKKRKRKKKKRENDTHGCNPRFRSLMPALWIYVGLAIYPLMQTIHDIPTSSRTRYRSESQLLSFEPPSGLIARASEREEFEKETRNREMVHHFNHLNLYAREESLDSMKTFFTNGMGDSIQKANESHCTGARLFFL